MFKTLLKTPRLVQPQHLIKGARLSNSFNPHINYTNRLIRQCYSTQTELENPGEQLKHLSPKVIEKLSTMRNIGISAHIDSGKTTLTERILFYTGRIKQIHEVKGNDDVGAKMDSMELEKERGITIKSAATYCRWGSHHFNIIDTPGHVDFTVEVERALRVLDGAVLVICGVGGVQSQTLTVDRQMRRYKVPRIVFVNKLDRMGANPWNAVEQLRERLGLNAAAVQVPIGTEDNLEGVVCILHRKAYSFQGDYGTKIVEKEIPSYLKEEVEEKRKELIERLANIDPVIEELYLNDEEPTIEQLKSAIRRGTIHNLFAPVFFGSALKNCGVQKLLDGVVDYLPHPGEIDNYAFDRSQSTTKENEKKNKKLLLADPTKPFIGMAFKLEESRHGQLTYLRVYQGTLQRGNSITNTTNGKRIKVPRIVRMHSDEMEEVEKIGPGEICAMFGVDCSSGDTFTSGKNYALESMFIPEPVISLSVDLVDKNKEMVFSKVLQKFQKEDPTFKVRYDEEGAQTIIYGMGELHLDIYLERMKREYDLNVKTGKPYVAFRETVTKKAKFDYLHKKQTGGAGQYARVMGYIEPLPKDYPKKFEFLNHVIGNNIPPNYITACEKGFIEASEKGPLIEAPVWGVRVVLEDGVTHPVDSSELAFRIACIQAFKQGFEKAGGALLEPIMHVEVTGPSEFQSLIMATINKRRGNVKGSTGNDKITTVVAEVPLAEMFGYMTELRTLTQGKGEFSMEYLRHDPTPPMTQTEIIAERTEELEKKRKK